VFLSACLLERTTNTRWGVGVAQEEGYNLKEGVACVWSRNILRVCRHEDSNKDTNDCIPASLTWLHS
jgi:hypothetical protein